MAVLHKNYNGGSGKESSVLARKTAYAAGSQMQIRGRGTAVTAGIFLQKI